MRCLTPAGDAGGKYRGSPKSIGFILYENFIAIHLIYWKIEVWTKVVSYIPWTMQLTCLKTKQVYTTILHIDLFDHLVSRSVLNFAEQYKQKQPQRAVFCKSAHLQHKTGSLQDPAHIKPFVFLLLFEGIEGHFPAENTYVYWTHTFTSDTLSTFFPIILRHFYWSCSLND